MKKITRTFSLVKNLGFNHLLANGDAICVIVRENEVSLKVSTDNNNVVQIKMDQQELYEIGLCCLAMVQDPVDEDAALDRIRSCLKTPKQAGKRAKDEVYELSRD